MINARVSQNWTYALPITSTPLSDQEWQDIVDVSGLPSQARPLIERTVAMYRLSQDARLYSRTPAETRALLRRASNLASALEGELAKLLQNPRAILALTLALDPAEDFVNAMSQKLAGRELTEAVADVRLLARWFSAGRKKVASGRRGGRERALQMQLLVIMLDQILFRSRGKGITRSEKRNNKSRKYILTILKIADPKARHFAIEDAMKRQIRARGRNRPYSPS